MLVAVFKARARLTEMLWQSPLGSICVFVCLFAVYLLLGIAVYSNTEEHSDGTPWTAIDAFYFTTAMMSTVGYGDLAPRSDGMRLYAMFMILFGILFIFPRIAAVVSVLTDPLTVRGRAFLEYLFPQQGIDLDGDGEGDYKVPRHVLVFYGKNMMPSLLLTIVLQLVSAAIFVVLEEWSFWLAWYHCFVTATTVGFGDIYIATQEGRFWASVHMILSVCMVGEFLSTLDTLRSERAALVERFQQLSRRLDDSLLDRLLDRLQEIRPNEDRDKDNSGLTESEFVLTMLLELDIAKLEQIRPFIKQFRSLDADGSGRLGSADLRLSRVHSPSELAKMRSVSCGGSLKSPSGVSLKSPSGVSLKSARGCEEKWTSPSPQEAGRGVAWP